MTSVEALAAFSAMLDAEHAGSDGVVGPPGLNTGGGELGITKPSGDEGGFAAEQNPATAMR